MTTKQPVYDDSQSTVDRKFGSFLLGLVKASHFAPTLAMTSLTTVLAAVSGRSAAGCVLVAATVLAGQLSVGWSNDAIDADRDIAAGRRDKPVVRRTVTIHTVRTAALIALACCIPLSFASGLAAGIAHLVFVGAGWVYNLGVKATAASWIPYVVGFGALPIFVALGLPGHPWPAWWAVLGGSLLGFGAHFADVLPDITFDLATGVRGLPQRLGAARIKFIAPLSLLAITALLVFAVPDSVDVFGWVGLVGALVCGLIGLLTAHRYPKVLLISIISIAAIDVVLLLQSGVGVTG